MRAVSVEKRTKRKKNYQPNLDEFLSQCELNYRLIKRLIPEVEEFNAAETNQSSQLSGWKIRTASLEIEFCVTDTAKYTTTMTMLVKTPKIAVARYVKLIVRLYHDAQMLEVMEGSGPSALKAIYEHPNKGMKTTDEKRQINRYVGECLRACHTRSSTKSGCDLG